MTTATLKASDVVQEGNTAVITGASSGIGRATALTFAAKGMNVWMVDIDKEELEAAKALVLQQCLKDSQV
jgi:NAD(P)-dependent dehydrogenase (short-subunit alcohol dehydrogenase family)